MEARTKYRGDRRQRTKTEKTRDMRQRTKDRDNKIYDTEDKRQRRQKT